MLFLSLLLIHLVYLGEKRFTHFVVSISVVSQSYDIRVEGNEVFSGNVAFLRCFVPEHVRKHVAVTSWFRGEEELLAKLPVIGK